MVVVEMETTRGADSVWVRPVTADCAPAVLCQQHRVMLRNRDAVALQLLDAVVLTYALATAPEVVFALPAFRLRVGKLLRLSPIVHPVSTLPRTGDLATAIGLERHSTRRAVTRSQPCRRAFSLSHGALRYRTHFEHCGPVS